MPYSTYDRANQGVATPALMDRRARNHQTERIRPRAGLQAFKINLGSLFPRENRTLHFTTLSAPGAPVPLQQTPG